MRRGQIKLSSGRREKSEAHFAKYPHHLVMHPAFVTLPRPALIALFALMTTHFEYRQPNNGHLHLTRAEARRFCLKSRRSYEAAMWELQHRGFIVRTQRGGLGGQKRRARYAVTWLPMDEENEGVIYLDHIIPWCAGEEPNYWQAFVPEQTVPHWSAANPFREKFNGTPRQSSTGTSSQASNRKKGAFAGTPRESTILDSRLSGQGPARAG